MHNVRYWLLLQIAKMPRTFTFGVGGVIAFTLILATMTVTVWLDQSRVTERHHNAIRIFQAFTSESAELLDHLIGHNTLSCNNEELIHLNTHLLQSRHLREIGLLDDDQQLICSTALGKLTQPIKGNYRVHTSASGLELLNDVPLTMTDKKLSAVIIQRQPFNVVVSPYATNDIYATADAAWLRTADDELILLRSAMAPEALPEMHERASRLKDSTFTLLGMNYELVTITPGVDLVLQTQRSLGTIMQQSGTLLPALLAGSLLIAVLAVGTITPYVIKLCGLNNRIGFLCDDAHLSLVYQPLFDLASRRPIGCEVLARLKEGKQSWMPDQIIPAVISAGLQHQFDHAVTKKAIRELAIHLPRRNGKFKLALNYFPESIGAGALIPVLNEALQHAGRNDFEICLEITEHGLSSELIAEVQCLKAEGFLIAVDDFGTGYSNLRTVTRLSPDLLKIDRSFVYELEEATIRSNLILEIVNIARAVNAETVAEGIESSEQVQLLAASGVRYGQGFALARPMEMAQFIAFMATFD